MSVLSITKCLTGQHKPVRRDVVWDGERFAGECRNCGKSIKRVSTGQWRKSVNVR
ncbi:hypothetical protein [Erythrobacter crassostreae]|uniref:Uncharacterized protein n=1 Tax=Erythrobacter crassostreae TaxID=2828328 RepID=A0A9X1F371_9SPHN|nr:hypothetical protein [Erythrobacter crassostrea]MBV7258844.1 hypothetical protein [Erythrobacter crassostrea]